MATARRAATGGTDEARRAGMSAASSVTTMPTTMATISGRALITSEPSMSMTLVSSEAMPSPSTKPATEPTSPTARASMTTARRTWRRLAPMARSSAISRVRCATTIENEL
jgi:hypothetical protein